MLAMCYQVKNDVECYLSLSGNDLAESESSPGEGNGYLPQYSCLGNPMDRGAWRATGNRVTESDMIQQLTHTHRLGLPAGIQIRKSPSSVFLLLIPNFVSI